MIPKMERYTLKQVLTDKKSNTNAYGRKGHERDHTQMPVAKKERPNHKCWWQTKNCCPNQSSKQLTANERNKTAETTSKPQTVAYLQALYKVEKNNSKHHQITKV